MGNSENNMSITIGMPTVNSEKRLSNMLDSLLNQTLADFKIVISNNASTDKTKDICESYATKDSRIQVHHQTERLCMRDNHAFLLNKADTEYFSWQQDDDILDKKWLETTHEVLKSYPRVNLAFTDIIHEKNGKDLGVNHKFDLSDDPVNRFKQLCTEKSYGLWFFAGFNGLWRTEHLQKMFSKIIETYDHDTLLGTDGVLLLTSELNQDYKVVPQKLYTKRVLTGQRTYRTRYKYLDRYKESLRMERQAEKYLLEMVDSSNHDNEVKKQLRKLVRKHATKFVSNASTFRKLKWRILFWYSRTPR